MAVAKESIDLHQRIDATVERLVRHAAGGWTFHLKLAGQVSVGDGRSVVVSRRVAVKATDQIGRKPVTR